MRSSWHKFLQIMVPWGPMEGAWPQLSIHWCSGKKKKKTWVNYRHSLIHRYKVDKFNFPMWLSREEDYGYVQSNSHSEFSEVVVWKQLILGLAVGVLRHLYLFYHSIIQRPEVLVVWIHRWSLSLWISKWALNWTHFPRIHQSHPAGKTAQRPSSELLLIRGTFYSSHMREIHLWQSQLDRHPDIQ